MKNILKNLSGGFFRTFGRVLFYVVFGLLIGYFFNSKGLKITDLIGFTRVHAATVQSWSTSQTRLTLDNQGTSSFTDWYSTPHTFSNPNYPVKRVQFRVRIADGFSSENTYNFRIAYNSTPDALAPSSVDMVKDGGTDSETFSCGNWVANSSGIHYSDCSVSPSTNYTSSNYLWITIFFAGSGSYVTSIKTDISGYDERLGTNAVITDTGNQIINNNNSNTNSIINNNNQNTQNIIDNQNANSQAQIEAQQTCEFIDKNSIAIKDKYLTQSGSISSWTGVTSITNYFKIDSKSILTKLNNWGNSGVYACFYDINKTVVSCFVPASVSDNTVITIPSGASYFRSTIHSDTGKPSYSLCKNGNQALQDTLTDDSAPDVSSLNDMAGWLPAGPLDSILNLPLTLLNSLNTALSGTCQPITMTLPYINENLTLPCISSIYQEIGAISFVNWVGAIASAFILFKYLMKLYKWVDDTLTFRENNWLDNWGGVD